MSTLEEAVAALRADEVKETAALVLGDKALQRVLAAWPRVPRTVDETAIDPADPWAAVRVDESQLGELCGLQQGPALLTLRRARALGLIYPDGTLHSVARWVLQRLIKDAGGK